MYRAGVIKINGECETKNFETKTKAEEWVLSKADNIKKSVIVNKEDLNEREITIW